MIEDKGLASRSFDFVIYTVLIVFALLCLIPFVYIFAASFTSTEELLRKRFVLFPTTFSLDAYKYIFSTNTLLRSLANSIFITAVGTSINLLFTTLMAYPLARKTLVGRKALMLFVIFTMLFSGGMIPTYLVVRNLGLLDTYWAMLIPQAINAFYLIIMKNFFQNLPDGLEESAKIDGCNDLKMLFKIAIPLSLPAIATFALFYAVMHWNTYFQALLYIRDTTKWPIQVLLRQVVILSQGGMGDTSSLGEDFVIPPQTVQMATIVTATVPILIVYPFLQKHFAKGVLLGSVKG